LSGSEQEIVAAVTRLCAARQLAISEDLKRFVLDRLPPAEGLPFLEELILAWELAQGSARALERFERDYVKVARTAVVRRLRGSALDAEDALQTLRTKLFVAEPPRSPLIARYAGTGPLRAWLKIVADRHALRFLRDCAAPLTQGLEGLEDTLSEEPDPELACLRAEYHEAFRHSLAAAVAALSPRQRALLRLRHVTGLSPERIAQLYHVHRTTITRQLIQARERLRRATRRELVKDLSLTRAELSSVVRLVRSQLPGVLRSRLRADPLASGPS
jgi:RNA polymerase sigma-70 factor (ECF subfamily)